MEIFIGILLIYVAGIGFMLYRVVADLDPRYRESAEESLVETSQVLAALADTNLTKRVAGDYQGSFAKLKGARGAGPLTGKIRMGLMTHGVDVMGAPGGFVSATHGGAEIEKTVHALRETVRALKAEREVKAA